VSGLEVPEPGDFARPLVCRHACFNPDRAGRQIGKESHHAISSQALGKDSFAIAFTP
jgi:hypothetical protein